MTPPLPAPGTKVQHKDSLKFYTYQGKSQDGWGDYYEMEPESGGMLKVPFANLDRYEVVSEEKQVGLFGEDA